MSSQFLFAFTEYIDHVPTYIAVREDGTVYKDTHWAAFYAITHLYCERIQMVMGMVKGSHEDSLSDIYQHKLYDKAFIFNPDWSVKFIEEADIEYYKEEMDSEERYYAAWTAYQERDRY